MTFGVALFVSALATGCGKSVLAPPPPVDWHDLATGEVLSARLHKPAFLFFHADWSAADKELDTVTFTNAEVRGVLRDFVAIRVNATDDEDRATEAAYERFGVIGVPTMIVADSLKDYPSHPGPHRNGASNPHDLFRAYQFMDAPTLARALREAKIAFDESESAARAARERSLKVR